MPAGEHHCSHLARVQRLESRATRIVVARAAELGQSSDVSRFGWLDDTVDRIRGSCQLTAGNARRELGESVLLEAEALELRAGGRVDVVEQGHVRGRVSA